MADWDSELLLEDGPWDGLLDSVAPTARREGKYLVGQNVYPLDPAVGDGLVGRPGFRVVGSQLGSAGRRRVQGTYEFTRKSGTKYRIAIVGGHFYTLDWGTEVWTEVLTAANFVTAAVTLSQTARIAFLTFSDKLLISDGVNTPWLWDGTTNGGITKLTNAPVFYGQPTTYVGRIFGIKATDPATFVWSQPDDATIGYEAGGYNNAWTFTQTDSNRLYRMVGTNEALFALRARSGSIITGTVTANFASASTKDALSETLGTKSPWGVAVIGTNDLIFPDANMHPHLLVPGGQPTPIWTPFRETLAGVPNDQTEKAISLFWPPASLLLMAMCDEGATEANMILVYDVKGPLPIAVGVWNGFEITDMSVMTDSQDEAFLFHGDSTGYVYLHGNPDGSIWDDRFAAGTVAIEHILELQSLGYSTKREKIFDRIDLALRSLTAMTLQVSAITPRGQSALQTVSLEAGVLGWDSGFWDQMEWDPSDSTTTQEQHEAVGIDAQGRWIKPRIVHEVLGERFGIVALTVAAYVTNDDPPVP